ncbi:MAG TPA: ATP-binding protein [Polyangiaceae bacterium]|nr:ATP-binding protein [Polyangiaceae bacterium]
MAEPGRGPRAGDSALRAAVNELADQLCQAVDGRFDFTVRSSVDDETAEKLAMLINFVLDAVRRGVSELEASNARLRELDRLKSRFLTNVSHELRTPLALVLGPIDAALDAPDALEPGARAQLERARRNALRLASAVDDLLDFARLEAGRLRPQPEPIDLAELSRRFADDARATAEARGLALDAHAPEGGAATTLALDRKMVEKIVANLVGNALKFTPAGGRVAVRVAADGGSVTLRVDDTGEGIDPSKHGLLFQRFQQIDLSATRQHGGVGIGLALVKEFAELMGGSVGVESAPGRGSSFWVRFARGALEPAAGESGVRSSSRPLLPPSSPLADLAAPPPEGAARAELSFDRPRVLVAEDNDELRAFLVELLATEYDVVACRDGLEAFESARRLRPDVVLSDVMMPRLDGMGLVARLKADAALRHVPVVLLTAQANIDAAVAGLDGGADDYLGKPFAPAELRARLRVALRLARAYEREALRADELAETRDLVAQAALASFARQYSAALSGALRGPVERASALAAELAGPDAPSCLALREALGELAHLTDGLARLSDPPPAASVPARLGLAGEVRALVASLPADVRARVRVEGDADPAADVAIARDDLHTALAHLVNAFARRRPGPVALELGADDAGARLQLSTGPTPGGAGPAGLLELELIRDEQGAPRPDFSFMIAKQLLHRNGATLRVEVRGDGALLARVALPSA